MEKEQQFDLEVFVINGNDVKNIEVIVENKKMTICELMEKCCEIVHSLKKDNEIESDEDDIKECNNLKNCVYFEFIYKDEQLLPYKTIDYYDIKNHSKLKLIIKTHGDNEFFYSDFQLDSYNQLFFIKQREMENEHMKIKEGLNILCQCQNQECIYNKDTSSRQTSNSFNNNSSLYKSIGFNFENPKQEENQPLSPHQRTLFNSIQNQNTFIFNVKSLKFDLIQDKKKLKCPKCSNPSKQIGCILYNKGVIFKGIKEQTIQGLRKKIDLPNFSNKKFCAKYIDLKITDNTTWSKLIAEIKDIDTCNTFEEYLINIYPLFTKEIAFLFNKFPILNNNTDESWSKTEDEKNNVFIIGESLSKERGIFKFNNSNVKFIGYLKGGEMNSEGYLINNEDITLYRGKFKNGMKHGKGIMWLNEKEYYEGEFRKDKFHGKGVIHYANGNQWEGNFEKGLRSGMGVFIKKNKKILTFYRNDKLEWNFTEVIEKKMQWDGVKSFEKEFEDNNEY